MAGFHLVVWLTSKPSTLDFHICSLILSSELPEEDRISIVIIQERKLKPRRVCGLAQGSDQGRRGGEGIRKLHSGPPYSRSSRAATDSCKVCALHKGTWLEVGVGAEV